MDHADGTPPEDGIRPSKPAVTGPFSGVPTLDAPAASAPLNRASSTGSRFPRPARSSRIRGGPIAAFVATALVLGVTAIPAGAPPGLGDGHGALAAPAPRATFDAAAISDLPQLPPIDLGEPFGAFRIDRLLAWTDRVDGTARLDVSLRSTRDPDGALEGEFVLRRPESCRTLGRDVVVPSDDWSPGFDRLRVVSAAEALEDEALAYLALVGELEGRGALEGLRLVVRNAPGAVVRRGPWRLGDGAAPIECVFARLFWMRVGSASRLDALPGGADGPSEGGGSLALRLTP